MPFHFNYNKINKILYCVIEGQFTLNELKSMMKELTESKDFPSDVSTLYDVRKLDFTLFDAEFEKKIISERKKHVGRGNAKIAFWAEDDLAFGMTRMFQILSSELPQQLMVFRDLLSAECWLLK